MRHTTYRHLNEYLDILASVRLLNAFPHHSPLPPCMSYPSHEPCMTLIFQHHRPAARLLVRRGRRTLLPRLGDFYSRTKRSQCRVRGDLLIIRPFCPHPATPLTLGSEGKVNSVPFHVHFALYHQSASCSHSLSSIYSCRTTKFWFNISIIIGLVPL